MEAPEKIYVCDNVFPTHIDWEGSPINTKRIDNHDIEYTRTDAFIEKVWNWIDENFHESEIDTKYGESVNCVISELGMCKSDIREKFENYMKGE